MRTDGKEYGKKVGRMMNDDNRRYHTREGRRRGDKR